jgi:hypothetical protein
MSLRAAILLIVCVLSGLEATAQDKKPNNWSVGGGFGWFHYVNTLDRGTGQVKPNQLGYTFRFMWEPEHRLAMGVESGYYTLYDINKDSTSASPVAGQASLTAIPIMLVLRMRLLPNVFLSGGPGLTLMNSEASAYGNTSKSSFLSLSNVHVSVMYRKRISERFDIGAEGKFLYFGKTEDYGFSVQVVGAYHFRFMK